MESQNPTLMMIKGSLTRPSWAFVLLVFIVATLFAIQITKRSSIFPIEQLFPVSGRNSRLSDIDSCYGFFTEGPPRMAVKSIVDFGGVGDGKTSNTVAFRRAMKYMESFRVKGGSQLNVPRGRWLTGSFNLTSNFTLFLDDGAVILGSQVINLISFSLNCIFLIF